MKASTALLALTAGALLAVALGGARQAQLQAFDDVPNSEPEPVDGATDDGGVLSTVADAINPFAVMQGNTMRSQALDPNVTAFLATLRYSEGTANQPDPYAVCYGYTHTVQDFSDHPAVTHEWDGVPLDNLGPRYVGLKSTAAGAYQIIKATWLRAKAALHLADFGPESQDAAAVWLIDKRGALDDIKAGDIASACAKLWPEWASLPGSTAGQGGRRLDQLAQAFTDNGGTLA